MPSFLQLSAIPLALKNEKLLKTQLIQFSLISAARQIEKGPIFRRVLANGRVGKDALTERAVWQLVREYAAQIGIGELAPHDLRRTAAKPCRSKGGELEQIQFLLGHESILTTERYLGSEQDLKNAVNDALVFE